GRFIDYDASFTQVDDFGNPRTSLIDQVRIHELIRTVLDVRPGADPAPDFLVNDVADPDVLPDTLYFSDGTRAGVSVAGDIQTSVTSTSSGRTVVLTATQSEGW